MSKEVLWRELPAYSRGLNGAPQERAAASRMFERDKDELRAMGIAIETVVGPVRGESSDAAGYRLARDFYLPRLRVAKRGPKPRGHPACRAPGTAVVSPDEAFQALGGLRELATLPGFPLASHAESAFRKLSFDLMPGGSGDSPVRYAASAEAERASRALARLFDAVSRKKKLSFSYKAMTRAGEIERRVRPYGLLFELGRWYLVGHDEVRDDVRVFRVGRMSTVRANQKSPGAPDFELPADFDLSGYANRQVWEMGPEAAEEEAIVHFDFPCSEWADRNGHGELVLERDDGSSLRRFRVRDRDRLARWTLGLAGQARIEKPGPFRRRFQEMAAAVAEAHGGTSASRSG